LATLLYVAGARPNFVKIAPLVTALSRRPGLEHVLAHTGQHYDRELSGDILADLELPRPDHFLGVGSGLHGAQTARALAACEELLLEVRPDLLVVAGDVNSTLAGALAAAKLGIPVAHLESGLRSFDWTMPEEINRVLTDRLSDVLLTHSPEAAENLALEGVDGSRVCLVGNTMVDSLRRFESRARDRAAWRSLGLEQRSYVLVTLHRPSNVDSPAQLAGIVRALVERAREDPVVFPVHPRTRARLEASGGWSALVEGGVHCLEPLGYLDFLSLQVAAGAVATDSGGIQEETSVLGVPCYTLRPNTERPITVSHGTNTLIGDDPRALLDTRIPAVEPAPRVIPLWDGHAAERAADVLEQFLVGSRARGRAA
jgi:UDP-N-acetylglucosamine 2-epimerase (non-hydrolysing)